MYALGVFATVTWTDIAERGEGVRGRRLYLVCHMSLRHSSVCYLSPATLLVQYMTLLIVVPRHITKRRKNPNFAREYHARHLCR